MRTTLITALPCAAGLVSLCAHAQQSEADLQALPQLRAKAEKGDAKAQSKLGEVFYAGKQGVTRNPVEALKWFRQAAEQNHPSARSNLGVCYERGDGVAKYEVEASKWYLLAAAQAQRQEHPNEAFFKSSSRREAKSES